METQSLYRILWWERLIAGLGYLMFPIAAMGFVAAILRICGAPFGFACFGGAAIIDFDIWAPVFVLGIVCFLLSIAGYILDACNKKTLFIRDHFTYAILLDALVVGPGVIATRYVLDSILAQPVQLAFIKDIVFILWLLVIAWQALRAFMGKRARFCYHQTVLQAMTRVLSWREKSFAGAVHMILPLCSLLIAYCLYAIAFSSNASMNYNDFFIVPLFYLLVIDTFVLWFILGGLIAAGGLFGITDAFIKVHYVDAILLHVKYFFAAILTRVLFEICLFFFYNNLLHHYWALISVSLTLFVLLFFVMQSCRAAYHSFRGKHFFVGDFF